jgi:hypothetical protein
VAKFSVSLQLVVNRAIKPDLASSTATGLNRWFPTN